MLQAYQFGCTDVAVLGKYVADYQFGSTDVAILGKYFSRIPVW
jgi:hypothetical protein